MRRVSERANLPDHICDYLRDAILNLRLKPGEQLNELRLIEELGVSRIPLREAFRLLEGEGLVVRHARRGVFVREVTANDIIELFPIRAALESLAAELAAPRLTKRELENLDRIMENMERADKRGDTKAYVKLNFEFHRQIVKGAGNKRLEEMIRNAGHHSMWFLFAAHYYKGSVESAMTSHREIYLALKERDSAKAGLSVKNHILEGGKKLLEYFPLKDERSS